MAEKFYITKDVELETYELLFKLPTLKTNIVP